MLSLKILLRALRAGELKTIFISLCLSVAVVAAVSIFAERIEKAIVNESKELLGSDFIVKSSKPIPQVWIEYAVNRNIDVSRTLSFASVVFFNENMHLAYIKAVESNYPLRGSILTSQLPFTYDVKQMEEFTSGPKVGEIWVESRLLPILNVEIGSQIDIGESSLTITKILIEEPEGPSFSILGSRILMNFADVESTNVVQPGSRVTHNLLVASSKESDINGYISWVTEKMSPHDQLIKPEEAQENISSTIDRGRVFLLLAGSIGIVLAAVALAMASHLFATKQKTQVALLKSWGLTESRVRKLYVNQSLFLGFVGSFIGLFLGYIFHLFLIDIAREWLPTMLPNPGLQSFLISIFTGIACVIGFILPALWHLPKQPPISILKDDGMGQSTSIMVRLIVGLCVIMVLLFLYSKNVSITFAMTLGVLSISMMAALVGGSLFRIALAMGKSTGGFFRIGLSNLWRRKSHNLIQLIGFSSAIFLFLVLAIIRNSLLDEWQLQIDDDLPNHFFINVNEDDIKEIDDYVAKSKVSSAGWYSMTRARITSINNEFITEDQREAHRAYNRELNLSWSEDLPAGNEVSSGSWWKVDNSESAASLKGDIAPVSVEHDLAGELGLKLGDVITFSVGGLSFDAVVRNTRILDWEKMTPNFYFLFPEGALEGFPRTSMTSMYIPIENKRIISEILREYPTIQVIELDKVFETIKKTINQVTKALEAMTVLILFCGIMVLITSVHLSISERMRESAVLRTFGCARRDVVVVQLIEFLALGLVSGLLGALGAEIAVGVLSSTVFDFSFKLHPWIWGFGPLLGMAIIAIFGIISCKSAISSPPLSTLRSFN